MIDLSANASVRVASYAQRLAKVRASAETAGHDLLIAYGSGFHSFLAMNPAWWLTGFKQMGPHMAVLIARDEDPVVIVTPDWDHERAVGRSALRDVISCPVDAFMDTVAQTISRRKFKAAKPAISGRSQMPRGMSADWDNLLKGPPANADSIFTDLARVRDEWSLKCAFAATDIAEKAYDRLLATARPGAYEYVVAGELEAYQRSLGADDNFQFVSASQHNRAVHTPTNRILEDGDIVLGEITPSVEGEYVQICRTAVLGGPNPKQQENFDLLEAALRAGMAAAKPGVSAGEVAEAINAPIVAAGYETYTKPPYMRTRGHCMSLGSMDPEIAPNSRSILQKGSVFVMHPNQYLPETGYFMCGEPVIITETGAKPLTSRMGKLGAIF